MATDVRDFYDQLAANYHLIFEDWDASIRNRRIVHQVWDWADGRRYRLHLYITREVRDGWEVQHYVSSYYALLRSELSRALAAVGFTNCRWLSESESGSYQPIVLGRTQSLVFSGEQ